VSPELDLGRGVQTPETTGPAGGVGEIIIMGWIEYITLLPINLLLKLIGYELVKTGKIEFTCSDVLYYPTPKETTFIIAHLIINNVSNAPDTITDIALEVKGYQYISVLPTSLQSSFGDFIETPFKVAPRGEGYYKKTVFFVTNEGFSLKNDFTVNGDNLKPVPAKLILKRATYKKGHIVDIAINLAPGENWPVKDKTAIELAKLYNNNNKLYEEHI